MCETNNICRHASIVWAACAEISKNKDGRILPLRGELLDVLERAAERRRLDCTFVFHVNGQPIGQFRKSWKTACKSAGLSGLIPHDLRRTAVRNMVRAGIPERVAMSLSGHKTRAIFDRYNIVSESDLAEAAERLHVHLRGQARTRKIAGTKSAPKAASRGRWMRSCWNPDKTRTKSRAPRALGFSRSTLKAT
jgi:integrase